MLCTLFAIYIFSNVVYLGEPLRRGVLALRAALACSRRAIRSITFAARFALARWFRYYPSRNKRKHTNYELRAYQLRIWNKKS
jgi:hypothetical protein